MKLRISLLAVLLVTVLFSSCKLSREKVMQQKKEEISVQRYDKLLSEFVRSNSFSVMQKLVMEYQRPTKILIEDVLAIGSVGDDSIAQRLQTFYSDTTLLRLIKDVEVKFPNLDEVEEGLTKAFRKLKKEVPEIKTPTFYSQISAFNESIVVVDTLLGISLDKYMGEDYPLYKRFYYDYQCKSMRPERIVPDCLCFYLQSCYGLNYNETTCLLDLMIHFGKFHYVVKKLLGFGSIAETMGYTEEEQDWCKENEKLMWEYIEAKGHLYVRDPMVMRYYMKPSPSIEMFGKSVPAIIGVWVGGQIVTAYMKKHKQMSLKGLLEFSDYRQLYDEADYLKR